MTFTAFYVSKKSEDLAYDSQSYEASVTHILLSFSVNCVIFSKI